MNRKHRIRYDRHLIARAGYPFILIALVIAIIAGAISLLLALPFIVLFFLVINFFRNPERQIPQGSQLLVAPADGRVIAIEDVMDTRYLNRRSRRVSIFMSPLNVHVNRIPCDGTVTRVVYTPGKKLAAFSEKASLENEQNAVEIEASNGDAIVFVQIAGFIAQRIICDAHKGDSFSRGERYGLIRFGSRMDVYLPLHYTVEVALNDRTQAGATVLARF